MLLISMKLLAINWVLLIVVTGIDMIFLNDYIEKQTTWGPLWALFSVVGAVVFVLSCIFLL